MYGMNVGDVEETTQIRVERDPSRVAQKKKPKKPHFQFFQKNPDGPDSISRLDSLLRS